MAKRAATKGRPPKRAPKPGDRVPLGLRVTSETKAALDDAAARSGRSQSQEAELRIEKSFHDQRLLDQALELAYGPQLAGLLLAMGDAMKVTVAVVEFAHPTMKSWTKNQPAFDQVVASATSTMTAFRPGDNETDVLTETQQSIMNCGNTHANSMLDQLARSTPTHDSTYEKRLASKRELLGDMIERIKTKKDQAPRDPDYKYEGEDR